MSSSLKIVYQLIETVSNRTGQNPFLFLAAILAAEEFKRLALLFVDQGDEAEKLAKKNLR